MGLELCLACPSQGRILLYSPLSDYDQENLERRKVAILVVEEAIFGEEACVLFEANFGDDCSGKAG